MLLVLFFTLVSLCTDVRTVQSSLEDVAFKLRIPQRKPWDQMTAAVTAAAAIVNTPNKVWVKLLSLILKDVCGCMTVYVRIHIIAV
jgi:hypothetical protein